MVEIQLEAYPRPRKSDRISQVFLNAPPLKIGLNFFDISNFYAIFILIIRELKRDGLGLASKRLCGIKESDYLE